MTSQFHQFVELLKSGNIIILKHDEYILMELDKFRDSNTELSKMSKEYNKYLQEHKDNVSKAFYWIQTNLPELLTGDYDRKSYMKLSINTSRQIDYILNEIIKKLGEVK